MQKGAKPPRPQFEGTTGTARIETFADGIFAIAITLLILEIRVPTVDEISTAGGLVPALLTRWPSYIGYLFSFVIIGIMWAHHHNIFRYIGRSNHTFIMLNIALLLCVSFLPFPTAVLAANLGSVNERSLAAVFYSGALTVTAALYNGLWRYAAYRRRLLRPEADPELVEAISREFIIGPILYAAATGIAFLSAGVSLAIHALLAFLYMLPTRARP